MIERQKKKIQMFLLEESQIDPPEQELTLKVPEHQREDIKI